MNIFSLARTGSWPFPWTAVFQSPGLVPFTCLLLSIEQSMLYMLLLSNPLNWRWSPINHTEQSQGQQFSWDLTAEWKADASLFFAKTLRSSGGCQCRALIKSISLHHWSFVGGVADNLDRIHLFFFFVLVLFNKHLFVSSHFSYQMFPVSLILASNRSCVDLCSCTCSHFFFFFLLQGAKAGWFLETWDGTQDQASQECFTDRQAPLLQTVIGWMQHLTDQIHLHNINVATWQQLTD